MFGFRSSSRGDPKAPRWVGERVDSLRRSANATWSALRTHDGVLAELENRISSLERRDRAEAQRERRATQAATQPALPPVAAPSLPGSNGELSPEQVAAMRDPWAGAN